MLAKMIAWVWIAMGVFVLIKPDFLKTRIQKKGIKKISKLLFAITVVLGIFLITVSRELHGIVSGIIRVLGIVAIIKGFLFLKGKFAEKMGELIAKQNLLVFRIGGLFYIGIGIVILLGSK